MNRPTSFGMPVGRSMPTDDSLVRRRRRTPAWLIDPLAPVPRGTFIGWIGAYGHQLDEPSDFRPGRNSLPSAYGLPLELDGPSMPSRIGKVRSRSR
jgi:hypothetical protein